MNEQHETFEESWNRVEAALGGRFRDGTECPSSVVDLYRLALADAGGPNELEVDERLDLTEHLHVCLICRHTYLGALNGARREMQISGEGNAAGAIQDDVLQAFGDETNEGGSLPDVFVSAGAVAEQTETPQVQNSREVLGPQGGTPPTVDSRVVDEAVSADDQSTKRAMAAAANCSTEEFVVSRVLSDKRWKRTEEPEYCTTLSGSATNERPWAGSICNLFAEEIEGFNPELLRSLIPWIGDNLQILQASVDGEQQLAQYTVDIDRANGVSAAEAHGMLEITLTDRETGRSAVATFAFGEPTNMLFEGDESNLLSADPEKLTLTISLRPTS